MNPDYEYEAQRSIEYYTEMSQVSSSMLREIIWQFTSMAKGGDGGALGWWPEDYAEQAVNNFRPIAEPTCRNYNYPRYPDSFFQQVCEGMGWKY